MCLFCIPWAFLHLQGHVWVMSYQTTFSKGIAWQHFLRGKSKEGDFSYDGDLSLVSNIFEQALSYKLLWCLGKLVPTNECAIAGQPKK